MREGIISECVQKISICQPVRIEEVQEGFNTTVGPQTVKEQPERLQQNVGIAQSY